MPLIIAALCCLLCPNKVVAQDYYVSVLNGLDTNPGTFNQPYKTISRAVKQLRAGDRCFIREGHYREVVHINLHATNAAPVLLSAYKNEKVIINGTEPLDTSEIRKVRDGRRDYLAIKVPESFEQLFRGEQMLVEARWPNMKFPESLWAADAWAKTEPGSTYGYVVDSKIPRGFAGKGLRAKLNVGHRFFTWSRAITMIDSEKGVFSYPKNLLGLGMYEVADKPWKKKAWGNGRYYFYDSLVLLDQEDEWFLDRKKKELYLLNDVSLSDLLYKKRAYGLIINNSSFVHIQGIDFFATTFQLLNCIHCTLKNSDVRYPVFVRSLKANDEKEQVEAKTIVSGRGNQISGLHLSYSNAGGIDIRGYSNVLENSSIHDVSWDGSLTYPAVKVDAIKPSMLGGKNVVRRNSIYNTGSVIVDIENIPNNIIAYNHIYRGGLASNDVSLIYTQNPATQGTEIHHNWVHDSPSADGGLCIRGDDQSRGLRIHHNIIWNCNSYGLVLKGDNHIVYNNTLFKNGEADILLRIGAEEEKPWRKQWQLLKRQNVGTMLANNHYRLLKKDNKRLALKLKAYSKNVVVRGLPDKFDTNHLTFHPDYTDKFCDKGSGLSGVIKEFAGLAPDVGVFECGKEKWRAGH